MVADPEPRTARIGLASDLDRRAGRGVLRRVVRELQPGLQQPVGVALHDPVRVRVDAPAVVGDDGYEFTHPCRQRAELHVLHRVRVVLGGREQVDVFDEASQPVEFGDADLAGAGDILRIRRVHQLEAAADDRDGV